MCELPKLIQANPLFKKQISNLEDGRVLKLLAAGSIDRLLDAIAVSDRRAQQLKPKGSFGAVFHFFFLFPAFRISRAAHPAEIDV